MNTGSINARSESKSMKTRASAMAKKFRFVIVFAFL